MNRPCCTWMMATAFVLVGSLVLAKADKEAPKVKFEVRLAQKESAEGLEEMVVPMTKEKIYVHKEAVLTNADIAAARAHKDEADRAAVTVVFAEGSRKKVGEFSEKNIGKIFAVFIDGKLVTAPVIRAKFSEKGQISGDFGREEAERIAKGLNSK